MLTDSYKRRFNYLRLSVTDLCNFSCNYCLPDGYQGKAQEHELSLDEISTLVQAFALSGTRKIRLTGGEPSLRKDLREIIQVCKQTEGIEKVAMTTNGYKLVQNLDHYIDAGLDALNISMDSLRPESFRLITGHNKLDEIKTAMSMAQARGFSKIKLNAVLLKEYNYGEFKDFLDFLKDAPVTLRFIELMQTGDNKDFFDQQHVCGEGIQQQLLSQGWIPVIPEAHAGPAKEFTHPDYAGNIGLIMPYSKDFCDSCNRLRVSSQGNLHLCLFADSNASLRPYLSTETPEQIAIRLQEIVLGKKAKHNLQEDLTGSTRNLSMLGG